MTKSNPIEDALKAPLPINEIEWRISRCGRTSKGQWAMVLAYATSRGVMNRLDDVFGFDGWEDSYQFLPDGVLCTLKVKVGETWISKQDGAPQTNFEGFKGGISDALKRTAVKLGVCRYLYLLSETFVTVHENKPDAPKDKLNKLYHVNKKKGKEDEIIKGWWITPDLPKWAQPH